MKDDDPWTWPEDQFIVRMKRERQRRQWTQQRLSAAVEEVTGGRLVLHPTVFTKLEREDDRRNLRLNEALFIAVALEVPLVRMLSNDDLDDIPARIRELRARQDSFQQQQLEAQQRADLMALAYREAEAEVEELREVLIAEDPEVAKAALLERRERQSRG
ncbi:hypothetical protein [Pedococcus sp. 2YAF34]|uniref:hypothetical protein n=1 Tax=Pedococcus sp. 2YAF34 TaxID=3233032 RepID=UPI003F9ABA33